MKRIANVKALTALGDRVLGIMAENGLYHEGNALGVKCLNAAFFGENGQEPAVKGAPPEVEGLVALEILCMENGGITVRELRECEVHGVNVEWGGGELQPVNMSGRWCLLSGVSGDELAEKVCEMIKAIDDADLVIRAGDGGKV